MSSLAAPELGFDWEAWLRTRFPAYLRGFAEGTDRPAEAVAEALARLSGDSRALARLGAIAWLLDPELGVETFVTLEVPRYLRSLPPRTVREIEERRGVARGRLDWKRTLDLRRRTSDATWLVTATPRRTFVSPGTRMLRWILGRICEVVELAAPGALSETEGTWKRDLADIFRAAQAALRHAAMRDLPFERPDEWVRAACAQDRDPVVQEAAGLAVAHDRLVPPRDREALQRSLERYSLAPLDEDQRFEIFALLSVRDALDTLTGRPGSISLIDERRDSVARWSVGDATLKLHYDQPAPSARHAAVMWKFFAVSAGLRPDVRVVLERGGERIVLVVDAKRSEKLDYLAASDLKMLGYVADQPSIFAIGAPQAIVVCLREALFPGATERISFVGPRGCAPEGALQQMLGAWLIAARSISGAS